LVLIDECIAVDQRDRSGVRAVHLGRDDVHGPVWPAHIDLPLATHADRQLFEVRGTQAAIAQFTDAVNDRVCAGACRIGLQSDTCGLPTAAKVVQYGAWIGLTPQGAHEASERSLQHVEASGKPTLRE